MISKKINEIVEDPQVKQRIREGIREVIKKSTTKDYYGIENRISRVITNEIGEEGEIGVKVYQETIYEIKQWIENEIIRPLQDEFIKNMKSLTLGLDDE